MEAWIRLAVECGAVGILALLILKIGVPLVRRAFDTFDKAAAGLDRNTRVLERIEGFLLGQGMKPRASETETATKERIDA